MPVGIVIAALAVIALVAFVALSVFAGSSEILLHADGWAEQGKAGE